MMVTKKGYYHHAYVDCDSKFNREFNSQEQGNFNRYQRRSGDLIKAKVHKRSAFYKRIEKSSEHS
jgi:hypothetical protein